jgi:hypothetical protein
MTESLRHHLHSARRPRSAVERTWLPIRRRTQVLSRRRWLMRSFWIGAAVLCLCLFGALGLWWRLNNGPIEIDVATPWLKAAIEQNFGSKHSVSVGGTQIERDEKGHASLRILDIVVRDADGTVVASAPKAEIGLSGIGLLSGHIVAQSLNLVGAETAIRVEKDGELTIFAGADKRPLVSAPVASPKVEAPAASETSTPAPQSGATANGKSNFEEFAAFLAWLDKLGETGLDGQDLREIGLKDGRLTVDDRRSGKQLTFDHMNVALTRPKTGGLMFKLEAENPDRPWIITAAIRPVGDGVRAIGLEARNVSSRDLMLALRTKEGGVAADLPLSASMRAEIAADGTPQTVSGEVVADKGTITDPLDPDFSFPIDRAVVRFNWDAQRRNLVVPFQLRAAGNQFTLRASAEPPKEANAPWLVTVARDDPVIDPIILPPPSGSDEEMLALNRANFRFRVYPGKRRIELEQADLHRSDARPSHNIGVALNGSFDFSGAEPRLAFGIAGTRMPTWATERMWPSFVAPNVRQWVLAHMSGGAVDRLVIAGNAPLPDFSPNGPPLADDGLSIEIETSGMTLAPVDKLPPIKDADLSVRITGQTAAVDVGRGTIDVAGRRLNVAGGMFRIADTHLKPSPSHTTFRVDGTLPAVAALLSSDGLKDNVGLTLDPAGMRGAVSAEINVDLPIAKVMADNAAQYSISADLTNFGADKLLLGHKIEGALLKATASNAGYRIAGDVKINGTPAKIEFVKTADASDPELNLAANLDEAARRRFGFDLRNGIAGTIPIRLSASIMPVAQDTRMAVEADLTQVKIDDLVPGWDKPAGRGARAAFTLVKTAKATRFEDLAIEGAGANLRGTVELDANGEIASADLPTFSLSEGDKASVKADRASDGMLRVVMRGDVYDGRAFVKSSLGGASDRGKKQPDIDLDIKLGTVAGHNGETLRGVALKMTRRGGRIRNFNLESKIGRDATLLGDIRVRARDNHPVLYFETADAGALFRFTDFYPRMFGGRLWVAMDPPSQDGTPEQGTLSVRDFVVRNEPALQRVLAGGGGDTSNGIDFSELHADFSKYPGKMAIRDGVVRGPAVGITMEGQIDYARNDTHLRGTFVPFYGINNIFGQIPIVGLFLGGGSNEGLVGITYEAVGPPSAPRVNVNPVTAITPGLLRKFVPTPGMADPNFLPPR